MKILFLSVQVGSGHNTISKNVAQKFTDNGHDVLIYEMMSTDKLATAIVSKIGFKLTFKLAHIANYFYKRALKSDKHFYYYINKRVKDEVLAVINNFKPDVIVSSHVAGYIFVKTYQNEFSQPVLNYFITTDFEITPGLCDFKDNEYIILPSIDFVNKLKQKNFPSEHILPYGLPINESYKQHFLKQQAIKELNIDIDENKLTVLVIGKKNGIGNTYKIVKLLSKYNDLQIICASGTNKKLKAKIEKLAKKSKSKIYSFKFNSPYIMTIADIMIGKTGGLSSFEAINKNVPIIALEYAPMPEYSNLLYLEEKNIAYRLKNMKDIYKTIKTLDIQQMKENCKKLQIDNTIDLIYSHIIEHTKL